MATINGVRERPILFTGPMVRAILDGRKAQTRRVVNPQPPTGTAVVDPYNKDPKNFTAWMSDNRMILTGDDGAVVGNQGAQRAHWTPPYGIPGDRLWVRETWSGRHVFRNEKPSKRTSFVTPDGPHLHDELWYWADGNPDYGDWERPRPSIHMPRWASRILLDVVDVRVERLNDISKEDARAEGVDPSPGWPVDGKCQYVEGFRDLWDHINGKRAPWGSNPWVWVITFKRTEAPHGDL